MHRYLKVSEVLAQMHVDAELLHALEEEDLIHPKRTLEGELVISLDDAERVRVVQTLLHDLEVNLPGVEVIMHMRDTMLAMQKQFEEILEALADELRQRRVGS